MNAPGRSPLLPIATSRQTWTQLRRTMRGRWWSLAAVVVVLIIGAALGLVMPATLGRIVDTIIDGGTAGAIWKLGVVMALAVLGEALFTALGLVAASRLFETVLARLRERMVAQALSLRQSVVERAGTGDLVSRASDDVSKVAEAVPRVVPALSGALFTIALTFVGMAALDYRYALAMLVIIPVHVLAVRRYLSAAPSLYRAERAAVAERAEHVLASLRGIDTVLAYRLSDRRNRRILTASWDAVRWAMRTRTVQNAFFGRLNLAEFLGMAAILIVGFTLVGQDAGTVGGATAAMLFFLRLFDPINQLLFVIDVLQSALASLTRIVGVIRAGEDADHTDTAEPSGPGPSDGLVAELRDVTFGYAENAPVLHGVSLSIRAGEKVALVGASGAGKSTLAALIARIHTPVGGTLATSRRTALVTQEVHVFSGTVRDNLTLTRPDATDAQVRAALRLVAAEDDIDALPEGPDTIVGTHGHALAPAQAQQLALARLALLAPTLAVLDEASAEAGSTNAGVLDAATDAVLDGRAALVVAHRLSQAARADRILVMDRGRIVEEGSHAALVASGGQYARLWEAWSSHRRQG